MVNFRALVTLLFLAVSSVADAATMSPSFETGLIERLAARKAAISATPSLKYATLLPEDVMVWRLMLATNLSTLVRHFQGDMDTLPSLAEQNPADTGAIRQFMNDARDFIVFFDDGVRSGDISDATWAPPPPPPSTTRPVPATAPPPPPSTTRPVPTTSPPPLFSTTSRARRTSSDGSSSHDEDSDTVALPVDRPLTRWPYTEYVRSPTYVPSVSRPYIDKKLSTQAIVALFIAGMVLTIGSIFRLINWSEQHDAELRRRQEEQDAAFAVALQAEEDELRDAVFVAVPVLDVADDEEFRNAAS